MNRRRMMMLQKLSSLPSAYTKLDYLETSNSHIDTGVNCRDDMSCEVVWKTLSNHRLFNRYMGAISLVATDKYERFHFGMSNSLLLLYTSPDNYISKAVDFEKHTCYMSPTVCKLDDITAVSSIVAPDLTFWLFDRNTSGFEQYVQTFPIRVYSAKFWEGKRLVRDFVPCIRNSDSKYGLYDLVNSKFYFGEGDFTGGYEQ